MSNPAVFFIIGLVVDGLIAIALWITFTRVTKTRIPKIVSLPQGAAVLTLILKVTLISAFGLVSIAEAFL